MSSGILTSFLGALQASVAVLLTIFYGVVASQFNLLNESSAKEISRTCVRLFLPALLIYSLGSNLYVETVSRYVPIFLWAIVYNSLSLGIGIVSTRLFHFPAWATPAMASNNTTSLPLLLVQALEGTGVLEGLLMSKDDTTSMVVDRAQSYFLVNAMVSNTLTFALGPKLLSAHEEDYDASGKGKDGTGDTPGDTTGDTESGEENREEDERTSLLPTTVAHNSARAGDRTHRNLKHYFANLPSWAQVTLKFAYAFVNAPTIGALIGITIGLSPPLHRVFFAPVEEGGVFHAWLTKSVQNLGDLFAALGMIVVGVKLGSTMRKMKRGEESGTVPWGTVAFVTFIRYIFWPLISVPLFWLLATKTSLLGDDPVMWFVLMLSSAGPPAMKLSALADAGGSEEVERMSITKFLTISYAISPLVCFAVVGSLEAAKAAKR